jgi:uncharacterized protein YukE
MPQVAVTPEEVRRFAAELKNFNNSLKESSSRIRGRMRNLGETWRDQEYKKFEREFEQTAKAINQFLTLSEGYVPFLMRKAQAADAFLKQR